MSIRRLGAQSALVLAIFSSPFAIAETPVAAKLLNPDISVDGLFSLMQTNQENPLSFDGGHDPHQNGFNLQQVELGFKSSVDPYFTADVNLVLTNGAIEVEEAYATSTSLPAGLQIKAGQFFTAFGRQNPTHPHGWDFANKPLVLGRFFGGDGLRNAGAQLSWLTPLPWYSELIASVQNSTGETAVSFNPTGQMRSVTEGIFLGRWANFFALSDDLSLNLGASYLTGRNTDVAGTGAKKMTRIYGGDLYLKFRRTSALSFLSFETEALNRHYDQDGLNMNDWGAYGQLNARLPEGWERWHVGLRYDWVGPKNGVPVDTSTQPALDVSRRTRVSPVVTFYPSEFSKVRVQYDRDRPTDLEGGETQHAAIIQLEFLMGAHGAHRF